MNLFQGIDASASDDDVIPKSFEAKWFNKLCITLNNDISASLQRNGALFDPKVAVQNMIDSLKEESAAKGKQVDDLFYQSLEDLKTDADFIKIVREFEELDALNNKRNMMTIGMFVLGCFLVCLRVYFSV